MGGGRRPLRSPEKPSSPHSAAFPLQPCLHPHLGLQLRQPGLAPQKLSLELGGAALKLHLRGQELLLVSCARQQARRQGRRQQGLRRGDTLGFGRGRDSAELSHLGPSAPWALHLTGGADGVRT